MIIIIILIFTTQFLASAAKSCTHQRFANARVSLACPLPRSAPPIPDCAAPNRSTAAAGSSAHPAQPSPLPPRLSWLDPTHNPLPCLTQPSRSCVERMLCHTCSARSQTPQPSIHMHRTRVRHCTHPAWRQVFCRGWPWQSIFFVRPTRTISSITTPPEPYFSGPYAYLRRMLHKCSGGRRGKRTPFRFGERRRLQAPACHRRRA